VLTNIYKIANGSSSAYRKAVVVNGLLVCLNWIAFARVPAMAQSSPSVIREDAYLGDIYAVASPTGNLSAVTSGGEKNPDTVQSLTLHRGAASGFHFTATADGGTRLNNDGRATFNFGQTSTESPMVVHTFVLMNGAHRPVTVSGLQSSCGCTSATLLKQNTAVTAPAEIGPGQELRVRVTVDNSRHPSGPLDKSVLVFIAGQETSAAALHMTGTVQKAAVFSPVVLNFGQGMASDSRQLLVTVSLAPRLLAVGWVPSLVSSSPDVQAAPAFTPNDLRLQAGRAVKESALLSLTYRVSLSPAASLGRVGGHLTLVLAGGSDRSADFVDGVVPVTGEIAGTVTASPGVVAFGSVTNGKPNDQRVLLSGPGVVGARVSCNSRYLTACMLLNGMRAVSPSGGVGGVSAILTVSLASGAPAGPLDAQVQVTTAGGQRLVLPVFASISSLGGVP